MSQDNVDVLLQALALANAGDIQAVADLYHPDAELRDRQHPPDMPEVLRGRRAIVAAWARWLEVLQDWTIDVRQYVEADPWVVADVRWRATGKDSNASIDWRVAEAYEVNDGKITRVIAGYPDVPTALTDLGLEP